MMDKANNSTIIKAKKFRCFRIYLSLSICL